MELSKKLDNILTYLMNEELSIELRADREGFRLYLPDGVCLSFINDIADIFNEICGAEKYDIATLRDPDKEQIILSYSEKEE